MSEIILIESKIFNLRGEPVMMDSDLAEIYQVETRVLNQAVKRNIDRFPEQFRFQLTDAELDDLRSQIVTGSHLKSQSVISRSQTVILNETDRGKNIKYMPYAFTEQGVAMLSAVLRSKVAVQMSIQIMDAFVQMRKTITNNINLLQLSHDFHQHKIDTDSKFEKIFKALEAPHVQQKQGIFFNGQTYDAYQFVNEVIKSAQHSIVVIDNYLDDSVITQLTKKQADVDVLLLSKNINKTLQQDIAKANSQYPTFAVDRFADAHDRFIIIDQNKVYHIGASLKDLGKKWFAFSLLEKQTVQVLLDNVADKMQRLL